MNKTQKADPEKPEKHEGETELRGSWMKDEEAAELDAMWDPTPYNSRASYVLAIVRAHMAAVKRGASPMPGEAARTTVYGNDEDALLDRLLERLHSRTEKKSDSA